MAPTEKRFCYPWVLTMALALAVHAQPVDCNVSNASPSATIALPTRPFAAAVTRDGCWVFVSGQSGAASQKGIAVMKRAEGRVELSRLVPIGSPTEFGMAITHDGRLLVVAASEIVVFLDVDRLISGAKDPVLGSFSDGKGAQSIYANITADDKLLFVSDEKRQSITVIDLERARANGYKAEAIVGAIPVGRDPIALTFSPDGKWLYTTSELAPPDWNWPKACKPERSVPPTAEIVNPQGAVIVVDVARARTAPSQAVAARIPAGCSPVRMTISPGGERIYVTARNNDAVLAFDTAKLLSDPEHARVGSVPVGTAPVPIALIDDSRKLVVGNSNRFAGNTEPQSLVVLDPAKITLGGAAVLGTIPAGAFPREMTVSADGHTLFLTNYGSQTLQVIDVARLPLSK